MTIARFIRAVRDTLRARSYASGGHIQPHPPDPDFVPVLLSPGYVSYDGGRTWQEHPDPKLLALYRNEFDLTEGSKEGPNQ